MKQVKKSKAISKTTSKKIKRMSRKATQTITAIQTSKTMTQASEMLGITRSALYERIKRYGLVEIIQELKAQAQATIDMASPDVAEDLVKVALGEKKAKRLEVETKKDILDRAGITKKDGNVKNTLIKDMSITFENY